MPAVLTITQKKILCKFVGHSYPYQEILEILSNIYIRTRNFCKFWTPVATIPGVRVQHDLYPLGTFASSVCPCHSTRNVWKLAVRYLYTYPELLEVL